MQAAGSLSRALALGLPAHTTSQPLRKSVVQEMQRSHGNAHVQRLLKSQSTPRSCRAGRQIQLCACGGSTEHEGEECATCRAQRLAVQRQEDTSDSSPAPNPARLARLDALLPEITAQTGESLRLRSELDALAPASSEERTALEAALDASREALVGMLEERIALLDEEIESLNLRIGPNPVSSPDNPAGDALGMDLVRREQERRQQAQQLGPLKRWQIRRQIGSLDDQMAAIDQELSTLPPVSDPSNPTADLLFARRGELEQRKRELAASLTSTATEYEQWDPRWGAQRYGNSPECTNIQQAGCGPTSLAIVLNYMYQEDPESLAASGQMEIVTPPQTATYAATHGRVCNSGTAGDTMVTNVSTGWPGFQGRKVSLDEAGSQIRSGNLVIFLCKDCTGKNSSGGNKHYGGHFMVLNGVNDAGTVYNVLDPGANEAKDILTISHAELEQHTGGFWIVQRM